MKIFVCDNRFEDMMTCIYDAWEEALMCGHDNIYLMCGPVFQENLLDEYIYVKNDPDKAEKVVRSVVKKLGTEAMHFIEYGTLSADEDALDVIYRFMISGFKIGHGITNALTEPAVVRLMEIKRNVGNEAHLFKEFVRFSSVDGMIYVAHIEPKCNVVEAVGRHFANRMPSEHFMIIDDTRALAIVHPKDSECYLQYLTPEELSATKRTDLIRDEYRSMWKTFFDTIAIKERINPRCQRGHMPLWMRKHAVEFMD